ncbi:MAG: galactose mutarotase [Planctomycetales bacterium]
MKIQTTLGMLAVLLVTISTTEAKPVNVEEWGTADGKEVFLYTLTNADGTICKLTNWGATVTELHTRDKNGGMADIVQGYESFARWLDPDGKGNPNPDYFGCTIGRYCNRIGNGKFELDGQTYELTKNNDPSHLHGGGTGWDKQVWNGDMLKNQNGVRFSLISPDGDENYPGEVKAEVVYVLTDDNELRIEFSATSDKATPISMTNHSYFNLSGEGSGTILDHELELAAPTYTVFDSNGIPTGEIAPVDGTPVDFTQAKPIRKDFDKMGSDPGGYDHNFVLRDEKVSEPELAATVYDPKSGRELQLSTTEVGIQFYTGNFLDGSRKGKSGKAYEKNFAFCLEPQYHPDSPNQPSFPSCILKPGEKYSQVSVYKFGVRK